MEDYKLHFITDFGEMVNRKLEGKRVLEIGCGTGEMLKLMAECYKPEMITGIDIYLKEWWNITDHMSGDNWQILDVNSEDMPFEDNSFDHVISISTFEHIHNIQKTLSEIKRVLKPYGKFYTTFSPIWTSVVGHHYNHWIEEDVKMIPPWGHLYMSESEMAEHIESCGRDKDTAKNISNFIYNSELLNRHTRSDLVGWVMNSGMYVRSFHERIGFSREYRLKTRMRLPSDLTEDIKEKIKRTKYKQEDLGVLNLKFVLEKYNEL